MVQRRQVIHKVQVRMHEHFVHLGHQHQQVLHSLLHEQRVHGHVQLHEVEQQKRVVHQEH